MARSSPGLHETDFYAWTREQAAALRRLAEVHWNGPLDLENLAEEVTDLGAAQRAAVFSQIVRLIHHLLKLEHSALAQPRNGWLNSADSARSEILDRLTPTIRHAIEEALPKLYARAVRMARRDLEGYGEPDAARALPAATPYALDQLLDENWYPLNRHGLVDES
jgi:hypothetical protein